MTERMAYRMFFLGRNFLSGLIWTLKPKKLKKLINLKTFSKKPRFFQCCDELTQRTHWSYWRSAAWLCQAIHSGEDDRSLHHTPHHESSRDLPDPYRTDKNTHKHMLFITYANYLYLLFKFILFIYIYTLYLTCVIWCAVYHFLATFLLQFWMTFSTLQKLWPPEF